MGARRPGLEEANHSILPFLGEARLLGARHI